MSNNFEIFQQHRYGGGVVSHPTIHSKFISQELLQNCFHSLAIKTIFSGKYLQKL